VDQNEKQKGTLKNKTKTVIKKDIINKNRSNEPPSKRLKTEPKQLLNKIESNLDAINYECTKLNNDEENYNIKICTWNIAGIRAVLKVTDFFYKFIIFMIKSSNLNSQIILEKWYRIFKTRRC
jgi:hypothetical protein